MHNKEFEKVTSLSPERRYEYFIKKVAAWDILIFIQMKRQKKE